MVPRRLDATTTQTLRRSREAVLVQSRVSARGPITALAAATPQRKVTIFLGGARQALASDPGGSART